jgi:hypothetical protein
MSAGGTDSNQTALNNRSSSIFQREILGMLLLDRCRLDICYHRFKKLPNVIPCLWRLHPLQTIDGYEGNVCDYSNEALSTGSACPGSSLLGFNLEICL